MLEHQKTLGFDGADLKDKLADLYARHEELCREAPDIPDTGAIDRELESVSASLERRKAEVYQSKYGIAQNWKNSVRRSSVKNTSMPG